MSNGQATFGIDIVANDKTLKGKKSAEKNLGQIPKNLAAINKRQTQESERTVTGSSRRLIRTFGQVEQSFARAFGGRGLTSGIASRISGITEAASAAGSGLGEAAAAGGVLEAAMGGVAVAVGATVGILGAAAVAAFKLADGWAAGAASIGRTAEILGVGTKAFQEFQLAAERAGVDRGTAAAAVGGISQSLNDAVYGRNAQAAGMLNFLGIKNEMNSDGTVNVAAMLPKIADAIQRQNSSGRRQVAKAFGISDAALPAFIQGGAALTAEMQDTDATGMVNSDAQIEMAKRLHHRHIKGFQTLQGQVMNRAGAATAGAADNVESWLSSTAKSLFGSSQTNEHAARTTDRAAQTTDRAAQTLHHAADKIDRAADRMGGAVGGRGGAMTSMADAVRAAQAAERKWGVPASISLGQYQLESSGGRNMPRGSNNPFGMKARAGDPYVWAWTHEDDAQGRSYKTRAKFRVFDSLEQAFDEHARLLATAGVYRNARAATTINDYADRLQGTYATDHGYAKALKGTIHARHFEDYDGGRNAPGEIPVKVDVTLHGGSRGDSVRVKAGRGQRPAVSHSFAPTYQAVHGG